MNIPHLCQALKRCINQMLKPFGFEIGRIEEFPDVKAEGFPSYVKEATKAGMDVNDWIEQNLGWGDVLPILERTVFPYLRENSTVCELGVGTGRSARHIVARLTKGELYLVDHSPWIVDFLRGYFRSNPRVHILLNDSRSLPLECSQVDLIFSQGTFIELKLGLFYLYSLEFFRVLKPGGYCVLDYIDITTEGGWEYLKAQSRQYGGCFTYHAPETVDRVFSSVGFEIVKRYQMGKSTYLTVRKPGTGSAEQARQP